MWRTRAIVSLLLDDIATPGLGRGQSARRSGFALADLEVALRRCRWLIGLDWVAILVLLALRWGQTPLLFAGRSEETVLTLGILAVAVHSGFLLGRLEKYAAVGRALRELAEREGRSVEEIATPAAGVQSSQEDQADNA